MKKHLFTNQKTVELNTNKHRFECRKEKEAIYFVFIRAPNNIDRLTEFARSTRPCSKRIITEHKFPTFLPISATSKFMHVIIYSAGG